MTLRILTAVIGLPLLIFIIWLNGLALTITVAIFILFSLYEYTYTLNTKVKAKLNYIVLALLSLFILFAIKQDLYVVCFSLIISFIILAGYEVFAEDPSFIRMTLSFCYLIYIPVMLGLITLFEDIHNGEYIIWLCFVAPFATDTFAYFGGKFFGKKKLNPISPNKTIAGSVIGTISGILFTVLYGYILSHFFAINISLIVYAVLGFIVSVSAQIGDIFASLIKRTFNIKDFGKILPGHGGLLDRFDSIVFVIPIIYMFTFYFFS